MNERQPVDGVTLKPTRAVKFIRRVGDPIFKVSGIGAVLTVTGRRIGQARSVTVAPIKIDGIWYLISFHGLASWAQNLRADGACELRRLGRTTAYTATEVPEGEQNRVIATYVARLPAPLRKDFARLPNPAAHPVFRMTPA